MRTLYKFHGGIHPPTNKSQSTRTPISAAPMPARLVIPFRQHAGEPAKPVVNVGDRVLKGQIIGEASGFISGTIHAPTSGVIEAIDMQPVAHPSELPDLCATLIPDGKDEWAEKTTLDYRTASTDEVRQHLRRHGIVGLGGAVFPSDVKLSTGKVPVRTLILNGAECEPYITCDDLLMRERAADIVQGAEAVRHLFGAEEVLIGIEDNKPEAIEAMRKAVSENGLPFEVVPVPTLYPGGSAKHLIRVLTGLEVPSGKLPTDIGVQCYNVATVYCIHRALAHGEPLLSRVVTITCNVERPQNYEVLIGTPVDDLLALSGVQPDTTRYIMGGPMMGVPLPATNVPVVKATNCVIVASDKSFPPQLPTMPCIRCGRCAEACPVVLQPMNLYWFSKSRDFGKAQELSLFDCIECGCCSYVCPSHIPLVQYFRFSKSEIWARERENKAAEKARERHEFREYRAEREKREKAERLAAKEKAAKAAQAAKEADEASKPAARADEDAQSKIQAAAEHAREQAAAVKPKNTEQLTQEQQADIAEIDARRAHLAETAQSNVEQPKE